jgi:hypothetical protein
VASKNQADFKILAASENQVDCEIFAASENQADYKILAARNGPKSQSTRQPKVWLPPGILLISVKLKKSLTRLTSVPSLSRKKVHNHLCCPVSAIILTTSKLEAILKIYSRSLKTVQ